MFRCIFGVVLSAEQEHFEQKGFVVCVSFALVQSLHFVMHPLCKFTLCYQTELLCG